MFGRYSFSTLLTAVALLLAGPVLASAPTSAKAKAGQPTQRTLLVSGPAATPLATDPIRPEADPRFLRLAGIILGADGRPCPGVCVFPTANPRLIAVTDATGTFLLQVPAATPLHLQAEYVGLGSTRIDVDAQHAQSIRIVLGQ